MAGIRAYDARNSRTSHAESRGKEIEAISREAFERDADKFAMGPGCLKPVAGTAAAALARGIASLEKRIMEHEAKLADFKNNPTTRPGMEHLSKEVIEKQQADRINHLEKEIHTFKDNIEKLRNVKK